MFDPVLGPLNGYSRGGPAAVSPYNSPSKEIDNDIKDTGSEQNTQEQLEEANY